MKDSTYRTLRRVHTLSGLLPVALYLLVHFATNATAIAGREAFLRAADGLERLPYVRVLEVAAIAVPIAFHAALGILLGNTAQGVDERSRYPRPWMVGLQRATGGLLVVFVVFHVWGIRFAPDLLARKRDLFAVTSGVLAHPGMLVFHVAGVLAASLHLGLGIAGAAGYLGRGPSPATTRALERAGWAASAVFAIVGLNALFAFVSGAARWLEP